MGRKKTNQCGLKMKMPSRTWHNQCGLKNCRANISSWNEYLTAPNIIMNPKGRTLQFMLSPSSVLSENSSGGMREFGGLSTFLKGGQELAIAFFCGGATVCPKACTTVLVFYICSSKTRVSKYRGITCLHNSFHPLQCSSSHPQWFGTVITIDT